MEEKKHTSNNQSIKTPLIVLGGLLLLFILLMVLKSNTEIAEWWTTTISRAWIWFAGHITGWFGFSLYELLFCVALVTLISVLVIFSIRLAKRKSRQAFHLLLKTICIAMSVVCLYTATASFSYNRKPMPIQLFEGDLTKQQTIEAADHYIAELNALSSQFQRDSNGVVICPYTTKELAKKLVEEYKRLDDKFGGYFNSYTVMAKGAASSYLMSQCWITGLFFAVTAEAHINIHCPSSEWVVTMAHEMAHSKGVMREDDANLLAYYLTLTSDDPYIKYSGMFTLFGRICAAVSYYADSMADYNALVNKVDQGILDENIYANTFWSNNDKLEEFEDWINDIFLKLSGMEEGTDSYIDRAQNEYDDTQVDGDNRPIVTKIVFSDAQKLIFRLINENAL